MSKPAILTVDDDPMVSAAITRDLRRRYGAEYRVIGATSGQEALDVLDRLALREQPVALVVTDQRMPGMSGIELLERARPHTATAKQLLLTAYADTEAAIRAINDVGLDHYLLKPWDPPEERLYPGASTASRSTSRPRPGSVTRWPRWASSRPGWRTRSTTRRPQLPGRWTRWGTPTTA